MVKRWGRRASKISLVFAVVIGVIYWFNFSPVVVTGHQVQEGPIVAEVMGTGTLEARVEAVISPKISGRLAEVLVDQGDRVQTGQLLVRLDDEELRQQVAIAQANVEASQAAIERLKADKNRAMAVAEEARKTHARSESLFAKNATSQEELERATEALVVAVSGVSRAEAAITEGQKELIAVEKTLEYQRARLADTEIEAPYNGLIVRRQHDPGDVVVPGSAILRLISTDELWISAWVDETEMAKLKEEQTARVVFRSEPDRSNPGKVVRLGREVDRETREFIVDVRVLELPGNWAVGQRAEVYIETARKDSVTTLPGKYVIWREGSPGVFIDRNSRAEWRAITVGLRSPEMVEVTSGLEAGDEVVIPSDPGKNLSEGQKIRP